MRTSKPKFRVPGGVHPAYHKDLARDAEIVSLPLPALLRVSMSQHLGAPAAAVVKKGDEVAKGQLIGEATGFISARVHAPASGTVKAVAPVPTAGGQSIPTVDIAPAEEQAWINDLVTHSEWQTLDAEQIVEIVQAAGVTGMGGAGFPTHVKLSPPPEKPIDTLILNGAECEPYLTADYRLMLERAEQVWQGCRIIRHVLGAKTVRVAIEDNKPEAIAAMEQVMQRAEGDVEIIALATEYPQGAEKQQIFAVTGKEVPSGGLPMDVGCLVENVGTAYAIWDAVVNGRPLLERITTVTGAPVANAGNILAPVGALYSALLQQCGGTTSQVAKWISGGPMMGLAQDSLDTPTTKTTSGIVALTPEQLVSYSSMPCISCGRCVDACPMKLMPAELSQFLEAGDYETAAEWNVMDCIECGCCAFACPARRPLVQHMRRGKAWVAAERRKK